MWQIYISTPSFTRQFSADNPKIIGEPLYDLVSSVFMLGYEGVIIDEIHYASNWSIHLKALYDDYPGKIIWISDSSSLVLRDGKADLSRRYVAIQMPLMSFREFLYLETGQTYPKYKLGDTILPTQPDAELLNHFPSIIVVTVHVLSTKRKISKHVTWLSSTKFSITIYRSSCLAFPKTTYV